MITYVLQTASAGDKAFECLFNEMFRNEADFPWPLPDKNWSDDSREEIYGMPGSVSTAVTGVPRLTLLAKRGVQPVSSSGAAAAASADVGG